MSATDMRLGSPAGDETVYRLMVENAVDVIVRGDAARRRTYVSPSSREVLGYEPVEMLGRHAFELIHPEDLAAVSVVFARIGPDHPSQDVTFRMRRKDGVYIWIEGRYRHLPSDSGLLACLRDVTAQKRTEAQLAEANSQLAAANTALCRLVSQDGLTGLANRRRFDEVIAGEWSRARRHALPLGLILLDVDHFKGYNDRYGHLAGDDCLRQVSATVAASLSRPGDHAARYGGEELAVLLPATELEAAAVMAEQMRAAIATHQIAHVGSPFGRVTVSAGAASFIPDATAGSLDELIAAADRALYEAKAGGRNCVRVASARLKSRPRRSENTGAVFGCDSEHALVSLNMCSDATLSLA